MLRVNIASMVTQTQIQRIGSVPIRCVKNFNKEQKETHVYWRCLYELVQHLFGWLIKNYAINTSLMSSTNGRLPSFLSYVANDKENVWRSLNCHNNKDLTLYVPSHGWVKSSDQPIFIKDAQIQCGKKPIEAWMHQTSPRRSHYLRTENSRDLFMKVLLML